MILKKTHAYVFEQNFSEFSLQLYNSLHLHFFSLDNCLSSFPRHRLEWFLIFMGCRIVFGLATICNFPFFSFFIFLFKWLIKQISEPLHTEMIHRVQSRQLLNSKIKSGSMFCYRLEYFSVFFDPVFNVFGCQQFVVDVVRYLFRCLQLVDKIIRLKDILAAIAQSVEDIVNNLPFLLGK